MTKEFVSYQIALDMKSIGFDEPCFGYYTRDTREFILIDDGDLFSNSSYTGTKDFLIVAPLYQQAFRWFREKHKLWVYNIPYSGGKYCIEIWRLVEGDDYAKTREDRVIMDSWEEAEQACLDKLIEIVKNKEND